MKYRLASNVIAMLLLTGCSVLPTTREPARAPQTTRPLPQNPEIASPQARLCHARLTQAGALFSPLPDRTFGAGCSTVQTVRLDQLRGDGSGFALSNLGPVTCPLAERFAAWARFGVDRAARQLLGSPLVRIETMGSYSCRNIGGSNRRSAHATAEAVDVGAFVLADGRRISLIEDWNDGTRAERRFLRVVHDSACKRFGTVLGPDYNSAHRDHFHLERTGRSFCR